MTLQTKRKRWQNFVIGVFHRVVTSTSHVFSCLVWIAATGIPCYLDHCYECVTIWHYQIGVETSIPVSNTGLNYQTGALKRCLTGDAEKSCLIFLHPSVVGYHKNLITKTSTCFLLFSINQVFLFVRHTKEKKHMGCESLQTQFNFKLHKSAIKSYTCIVAWTVGCQVTVKGLRVKHLP